MKFIRSNNELLKWGSADNLKYLWEWIPEVDLNKWQINSDLSPVSVRNFLTQYTDYTPDIDQFKVPEYWQDTRLILHSRNDDCEGLNGLACSILYTLGYDCRLTVGRFDYHNLEMYPENRVPNHAFGLLFPVDNEFLDDPLIIECTGDDLVKDLPRLSGHWEYYPWYMGSAIHQANYCCEHAIKGCQG